MNIRMIVAGLAGFLAVALAAFGAHGLPDALPAARRDAFDIAAQLHLAHAIFLAGLALAPASARLRWSYLFVLAGMMLFCGALYAFALTGARAAALIAPIGGASFMAGWILFAAAGFSPASPAKANR